MKNIISILLILLYISNIKSKTVFEIPISNNDSLKTQLKTLDEVKK